MRYSESDTIKFLSNREFFPYPAMENIHCCLKTMVYREIRVLNDYKKLYPKTFDNNINLKRKIHCNRVKGNYLVIDMDRLQSNICSINKIPIAKSLDFAFAVRDNNRLYFVMGDFKFNKVSKNVSPKDFNDLEKKYENSKDIIYKCNYRISNDVYVVYPDDLLRKNGSVIYNNYNRLLLSNSSFKKFKIISLKGLIDGFFIN